MGNTTGNGFFWWAAPGPLPWFNLPWDGWVDICQKCLIYHVFKHRSLHQVLPVQLDRGSAWNSRRCLVERSLLAGQVRLPIFIFVTTKLCDSALSQQTAVFPVMNRAYNDHDPNGADDPDQVRRQLRGVLPFSKGEKHPGRVQQ